MPIKHGITGRGLPPLHSGFFNKLVASIALLLCGQGAEESLAGPRLSFGGDGGLFFMSLFCYSAIDAFASGFLSCWNSNGIVSIVSL